MTCGSVLDPLSAAPANPSAPAYLSRLERLTPPTSRSASLDRSSLSSHTGPNPFRDPSLELSSRDPSFDSEVLSALSPVSSLAGRSSLSSTSRDHSYAYQPPPPQAGAELEAGEQTPRFELQRQLADAVLDDLPRVSEESVSRPVPPGRPASAGTDSSRTGKKDGLWYQFRTGSGWFAPLVEPDQPLTPEQRAAAERARIDKLKEGRTSSSARRPGLMKRMSSGVEMGFKGRSRSGSNATIGRSS
ncbi:hypothetical protein Rhopal_007188-T1 [Rhodotorula paludigena]|uniref:WW domain-containing protein n=1 Tax=Rhodotorula paludigena TaxID=86838 RepID=A0AAV5GY63_9BASI|nr:hypothetical protein Rhopal_007188-T1 [Rhodotorula paludigena]